MEIKITLAQLVAEELRRRENKSVKSLFWNNDIGNLSVFVKGHTPETPKSFNYVPDALMSVSEIADYIADRCENL